MNLILKDNLHSRDWDEFIKTNAADGGFLQSWQWGEFQKSLGRKIRRWVILDEKEILAVALITSHNLSLGLSYWYLPRGPVLKATLGLLYSQKQLLDYLWQKIKAEAKQEKVIFLRLDPPWTADSELIKSNFKSVGQVQPQKTLLLDLTVAETELLKKMKAKTRYNIKVAEKHGVEIVYSGKEDLEIFWQLMIKTSARDRIASHPKNYYAKMLSLPDVRLALAKYQDKVVAGNIMAFFGQRCYYLHGASDYDFRDKMAPYLLQWQMIKDAKSQGCRWYDFWGADEKRWPGVTRFKVGFAPETSLTEYVGAYDLVYNRLAYTGYNLLKKIRG